MNFQTHPIHSRRGFTLVELLVAMSITMLIIVVLVSVASIASDHWNRSRAEVRSERQARALLDRMASDLEALVVPKWNQAEWFAAGFDEGISANGLPEDGGGSRLVFFTAPTDRYRGEPMKSGGRGDVSAVSYTVRYRDASGAGGERFASRILYRHLVDPGEAFEKLMGTPDLAAAYGASYSGDPKPEDFLCENLVRYRLMFHVSFPTEDGKEDLRRIALGNAAGEVKGVRINRDGVVFAAGGAEELPRGGKIIAVEISAAVVGDAAMERLRKGAFKDNAARDALINDSSFRYSRLVGLPRR